MKNKKTCNNNKINPINKKKSPNINSKRAITDINNNVNNESNVPLITFNNSSKNKYDENIILTKGNIQSTSSKFKKERDISVDQSMVSNKNRNNISFNSTSKDRFQSKLFNGKEENDLSITKNIISTKKSNNLELKSRIFVDSKSNTNNISPIKE